MGARRFSFGGCAVAIPASDDLCDVMPCSEEQRLASELDYLVFRRILTPLQVRCHTPGSLLSTQHWQRLRMLPRLDPHAIAEVSPSSRAGHTAGRLVRVAEVPGLLRQPEPVQRRGRDPWYAIAPCSAFACACPFTATQPFPVLTAFGTTPQAKWTWIFEWAASWLQVYWPAVSARTHPHVGYQLEHARGEWIRAPQCSDELR